MKLPTVKRGPVTLSGIDFAPRLSEETYAFIGTIAIDGVDHVCEVRNDGRGGNNNICSHEVHTAIEAYAKTLPEHPLYTDEQLSNHVDPEQIMIQPTADYLVSDMVTDAIHLMETRKKDRARTKAIATGKLIRMVGLSGDYTDCNGYEARIVKTLGNGRNDAGDVVPFYRVAFINHPNYSRMTCASTSVERVTS